jgi:double-stranded uracil-DNA glycosylase
MLNNLLTYNLKIVICGTAAGTKSAQLKQYYAKPGNRFWKALFEVGLTPTLLKPSEYENLLSFGIGLTDLVKTKSGMDSTLEKDDFDTITFDESIKKYAPKILCFNGKRAAETYLQRPADYGLQPETIGMTKIFVAPSTSGAASKFWDIEIWRELANLSNSVK